MMGCEPIIYSFGDYHHSPPVDKKGNHNVFASTYTDSYEFSGRIDFQYFINIYPADDTYFMVVIM